MELTSRIGQDAATYLAFFKQAFKLQMVYRLATLLSLGGAIIIFFIQYSLWSILTSTGIRPDIQFNDMIAYVILTGLAGAFTSGNIADELGGSIRDGSVIMHFLRPLSFRMYLLSSMLGKNCYRAFTSALPVLIAGCIFIRIPLPPSAPHALVFSLLMILGIFIIFELIYVVGLLAFWTQATWYLSWYVRAGVAFFGGTVIPLWFYPGALEKLSQFLPFRYISFEAINYYLGKLPLEEAARSTGIAALWWFLLFAAGHVLWGSVQNPPFGLLGGAYRPMAKLRRNLRHPFYHDAELQIPGRLERGGGFVPVRNQCAFIRLGRQSVL
jgi:ABC-2 type transport system permease protein